MADTTRPSYLMTVSKRVRVGDLKVNDTFYLISGQHGVVKSFKTTRYATPEGEYVELVAPYCAIHYEGGLKWKELHPSVEVTVAGMALTLAT